MNKLKNSINKLKQIINQNNSFAIFMHENPDGDTIGAGLAVGKVLENLGKEVNYFCPTEPSSKFFYLKDIKKIQTDFDFADYDVLMFVDIGSVSKQLSKFWCKNKEYWRLKYKVIFDHHFSAEDWGDLTIRDHTKSSTCQLIYEIFYKEYKKFFNSDIADFLFLGHITDTNFCKRSSTGSKEMRVAADLIDLGANKDLVVENIYYNSSIESIKFLGVLISRIEFLDNIVWTYYIEDELKKLGVDKDDADFIMDIMRKIKIGKVYVLVRKINGKLKFSIRTKEPIADKIAKYFGGGGHKMAAGFKVDLDDNLTFEKQVENYIKMIKSLLKN